MIRKVSFFDFAENLTNTVGLSRRDLLTSVTIILVSILSPVAQDSREPVQFAVIFLVGRGVTGVPDFRLLRYAMFYVVTLIAVWLLAARSTVLLPQG